ncbi:MAG: transglutaminase domain-containing protein [Sedimentisphaerales bacterium]|nr:transglutaminase domain-containing protein [Sedimentisphaerales bacterium]
MTDPGKYAHLYEGLPEDVSELCRVVQGLLLHVFHTHRYGVTLTEQRKKEVRLREVELILQRALELDEKPLIEPREPEKRVISHCRDYAVLLCSFLRYKAIPARVRAGFATYFEVLHQSHWICEYWCEGRKKWVIVDAQLDAIQAKHYGIDFDPLDVPAGKFLYAGQEYELIQKKGDSKAEDYQNWLYEAKRSLIQDFAALNKVEVEVWDITDFMNIEIQRNSEIALLFRHTAELTASPYDRLFELRALYENHIELQIPIH